MNERSTGHILTGAPGAGKTTIVDALRARGHRVVTEAATDLIAERQARGRAEPWRDGGFVDAVVTLQRERQARAPEGVVLYDRSPLCTLALAHHLGVPVSRVLDAEVRRAASEGIYDRRVFLVQPLGFVTRTAARRLTVDQALEFGRLHERVYQAHGFDLVPVPPGPVEERVALIESLLPTPPPARTTREGSDDVDFT